MTLLAYVSLGQVNQNPAHLDAKIQSMMSARPSMDIYGAIPVNGGWGFGFGFFSKPIFLEQIKPGKTVKVCIGTDIYFLQNAYKELGIRPLLAPQSGDASISITQNNFGFNLVGRFLFEYSNGITPYVDIFTGVRGFSTDLRIKPLKVQEGYEESTSINISEVVHWNYGATVGLLYALGKSVKLNVGFMYTTSSQYGEIENVKMARLEGNTLAAQKMYTPKYTYTLKVGITFLIPKSSSSCHCKDKTGSTFGLGDVFSAALGGGLNNSVNINVGPSR
jgi:hypothetical protein